MLPGEVESYRAALPLMARAGLAWTLVEGGRLRLRVMPELTKMLANMLNDTAGTKAFGRELGDEWRDVWKAVGIEATAFDIVSLRLGYFEDLTSERGGILYGGDYDIYVHRSIFDILSGNHTGKLRGIGLCWGIGISYKDYFRFDVSSDAAVYDFPTANWKFSLVANDIAGGIRELKQGHAPWEN